MSTSRQNRVNMADVARESGVSVTTVSLVLSDKPGLPAETRQRVLDAARQLGYRIKTPSLTAHVGSIHTAGLLVKMGPGEVPQANQFYSHVIAGIESACRQRFIDLLFAGLPVDGKNRPVDLPPLLQKGGPDGLLLVGAQVDEEFMRVLSQAGKPIVLVDGYSDGDRFDSVVSDNIGGIHQAMRHLVQMGHGQIGFIGGSADAYPSFLERRAGYLSFTEKHNLPSYTVDCYSDLKCATDATLGFLQKNPQITALVGCNDEIAVGAMHAITELGCRVGEDISVIGFDDIATAKSVLPPLTTLQVDKLNMGRMAVQLLINRSEIPEASLMTMVLRPKLMIRNSVKMLQAQDA